MLRRLAELDLLRRVEVISTVSGGSIVGALYALLLKRELERSERLGRRDLLALVDELTRRTKRGIARNPRARLLLDPLAVVRAAATSHSLGRRMARLCERHFFAPVVDQLEGVDARDGGIALPELRIRPGGRPMTAEIEAHNHARLREIRDGEPAVAVPRLVLNATSLNSGERFRFTAVEIGDRQLGHVRRDEAPELLDRKRLLEDRVAELRAGGGPPGVDTLDELLRQLRTGGPAPRIRRSASAVRTAALARWWRDGGPPAPLPPEWSDLAAGLPALPAGLARAEMGLLRQAKLAAWYLRVGRAPAAGPGRERSGGSGSGGGVTGGRSPRQHWRRLLAALEEIDPRLDPRAVARFEAGPGTGRRRARGRRLLDFVLEMFWIRSAARVSFGLEDGWNRLTLGHAVAASAAFPPFFAPLVVPGIWDDDRADRLSLTDGGVFDNMGVLTLLEEECEHVIASDAGGRVPTRRSGPAGRIAAGLRSLDVLRKAVAGHQREHMRERRRVSRSVARLLATPPRSEEVGRDLRHLLARRRLDGLAYFHLDSPRVRPELRAQAAPRGATAGDAEVAVGRAGDPERVVPPAPDAGLDTELLAGLRTDLDAFGEIEAAALIDRGYETADQYVRAFLSGTLGGPAWTSDRLRPRLPEPLPSPERVHRVLRAGSARFFRPLRLLRLEHPRRFRAACAGLGVVLAGAVARAALRTSGDRWAELGAAAVAALPWLAALPVAAALGAVAVGAAGLLSGRIYRRMTRVGGGPADAGRGGARAPVRNSGGPAPVGGADPPPESRRGAPR